MVIVVVVVVDDDLMMMMMMMMKVFALMIKNRQRLMGSLSRRGAGKLELTAGNNNQS